MFEVEDILKSTNLYLVAKDKNLNYLYCNENIACGLGLDSPQQIVGKTDYDLFPDNIAQLYQYGDICTLKGGAYLNRREMLPHVNAPIQILTSKNKLRNAQGEVVGVVVTFVDVTDLSANLFAELFQFDSANNRYTFNIGKQQEYFTLREYEVFKKILLGLTTKQIAEKLNLSARTVDVYVENIKRKLQCCSKYHIIEAAMRLGLVHHLP